jgi:hypothetical protein
MSSRNDIQYSNIEYLNYAQDQCPWSKNEVQIFIHVRKY